MESDRLAEQLTGSAGYNPRAMMEDMRVLEEASRGAGRQKSMQTHLNHGNRNHKIQQANRKNIRMVCQKD